MQIAAEADILKPVAQKTPVEKRFTVLVEQGTYKRIERVAETRKRSVSSEAGMALTTMYEDDPYLMDTLTGIALKEGIRPAAFLKKLVEDYLYNQLAKEREPLP